MRGKKGRGDHLDRIPQSTIAGNKHLKNIPAKRNTVDDYFKTKRLA